MSRIFVPLDSAAVALGADGVAAEIRAQAQSAGLELELVRNGSRGLVWLEPLVEVETAQGRVGYGPVSTQDIESLYAAGFTQGRGHPLNLGPVEDIAYLRDQKRITYARCGVVDPLSFADYEQHGGLGALRNALAMSPTEIVAAVETSGLRGRGGAGFPAGIKWRTVHDAQGQQKYIVCNADEGDSGTFADRMIMEGDPFRLIEGMVIAGCAVGATRGYIYLRSEYPVAERVLSQALAQAYAHGLLGENVLESGRDFELALFIGAGAYICGEETSLLESLEGKRGQIRAKPPLPALEGLFAKPTLMHNVVSLCAVPDILEHGGEAYAELGVGRSRGTMPFQLAGNVKHGGLIELPFGVSVRELVERFGGGTRSGRPIRAVQIGGPLGAYLPERLLDLPLDYEVMLDNGAGVGHGGLVVFDESVDLARQSRYAFEFCARESCGKCTPCRVGAVRGTETMDRIIAGQSAAENIRLVEDLCEVMELGSLCGMGAMTPIPVKSALEHFPEDFRVAR
ncbi:MAG: NADH-ubiquinone oxidoreductase-F iron-sulfur binding region domain-containing protein [Pseudomonadales bacterium]